MSLFIKSFQLFIIYLVIVVLSACTGNTKLENFKTAADAKYQNEGEGRLWAQASLIDKSLRKSNKLLNDPNTDAYLQEIMDEVFPEFSGKIQIKAVNLPSFNAFALPNGSIYIHVGLLARLENEAQLASILAHEGIHFVNRHGAKQRNKRRTNENIAATLSFVFTPIFSNLALASSVAGYSQTLEFEADNEGFKRLVSAGYNPHESVKVFQFLADEIKINKDNEPYFFATHPRLVERISSFKKLSQEYANQGKENTDLFLQRTFKARMAGLSSDLEHGRYENLIHLLNQSNAQTRYQGKHLYYLGEAYRRRGKEGDLNLALENYLESTKQNKEQLDAYKGLGLVYRQLGKKEEAILAFENYLSINSEANDRGFIESYIKQLLDK